MKESIFKAYIEAAKAAQGEYSIGYQHGIRAHHHGDTFQAPADLADLQGPKGDGYRDGVEGLPYPTLAGEDFARLTVIGEALYGSQWQSELGRLVGVDSRRVRHWTDGTKPVPPGIWAELDQELEIRINRLEAAKKFAKSE